MITIMPAKRPDDDEVLAALGVPAHADALLLRDSGGEVLGHAVFAVNGDTVEVICVQCPVPMLAEGLIRAVLNAGDCRGAAFGLCRDADTAGVSEAMLRGLEFAPAEDGMRVSIEAFFRSGCRHGEK